MSLPWWVLAIFLVWGITGWMYLVPIQHHLLSLSKRFGALTVSLNSSVLYAGIAAGGMLGGLTLYALPAHYLPLFSLPLGAIALLLTLLFFRERPTMNEALPVLYERHGEQVAVITLNRPEKERHQPADGRADPHLPAAGR